MCVYVIAEVKQLAAEFRIRQTDWFFYWLFLGGGIQI